MGEGATRQGPGEARSRTCRTTGQKDRPDEATLASDPATGSGDMRFDHWFEDQYWADETDGGE